MGFNKNLDDVKITEEKTVAKNYFETTAYRLRHRLFEGGWSDVLQREVFQRKAVVAVLPYDPVLDRVVLIEQFRMGAYVASKDEPILSGASPWLIEVVAGVVEDGEAPIDVAKRELIEESGCDSLDIFHVADWHASPGAVNEPIAFYCAKVDSVAAEGVHGLDHEHEDIRVFTLGRDDIAAWLSEGRIANATTIIAMQWFLLNYDTLRKRWAQ